jgi:hypothetical protein
MSKAKFDERNEGIREGVIIKLTTVLKLIEMQSADIIQTGLQVLNYEKNHPY